MTLVKEFKAFVMRGNVVDLAVGVVIGAAFGKIVSSLVADLIMPPIGLMVGGVNFTDLKILLKAASIDEAGKVIAPVTMNVGNFLQTCFDFLIIAAAIFVVVKIISAIQREKKDETSPAAPTLTKSESLLQEIRDQLARRPV